jgi:hypothetical protein
MTTVFDLLYKTSFIVFVLSLIGGTLFLVLYLRGRASREEVVDDRRGGITIPRRGNPSLLSELKSSSHHTGHGNETLPNGWERQDYYDYGIDDKQIEYWGLDQPNAPGPYSAGMVIADIATEEVQSSPRYDYP